MQINCDMKGCLCRGSLCYGEDQALYVSNAEEVRDKGVDIAADASPPFLFTLCESCWEGSALVPHGRCYRCQCTMTDDGILIDKKDYCRNCLDLPEIAQLLYENVRRAKYSLIFDDQWNDLSYCALQEASHIPAFKVSGFAGAVLTVLKTLPPTKDEAEAARLRTKRKAVSDAIESFMPEAYECTRKRIQRVFEITDVPTSLDNLLTEMLKQQVVAQTYFNSS